MASDPSAGVELGPEKILARIRERYRGQFPHERLIIAFDRRAGAVMQYAVIAVDRASAWYDVLPAEQLVEIRDLDHERALQ